MARLPRTRIEHQVRDRLRERATMASSRPITRFVRFRPSRQESFRNDRIS